LDTSSALKRLSEATGVSGYEAEVRAVIQDLLTGLADEVRVDRLGNLIAVKRATAPVLPSPSGSPHRVMLAAHMDEIGLMVSKIEKGFLHVAGVGGFDQRVLPGQEVLVHARQPLPGIIGSRPPHVLPRDQRSKVIPMSELLIDVGLLEDRVMELVRVGDLVSLRRQAVELQGGLLAGKALDNRACVTAMIGCLDALRSRYHTWDVFAVATVQEEVSLLGAFTATFGVVPDVGVALDVTFGDQVGVSEDETLSLGKGPAIAFGPNIHPRLFDRLVEVAKANEIPYQVEPTPGATGTDAWAMQITQAGIPTALVSIPLRYMHTSVETVNTRDVERAARLLADFIAGLDDALRESLKLE
jgi:putative aminopeptidase FrvX